MGNASSQDIFLSVSGSPAYIVAVYTPGTISGTPVPIVYSSTAVNNTFPVATKIMASLFPISSQDVSAMLNTGKPTPEFVGISWSVGQPAPVPSYTGPALDPNSFPPPSDFTSDITINGIGLIWIPQQSAQGPRIGAYMFFNNDLSTFRPNPNNAVAPAPTKLVEWTKPMTATFGIAVAALALVIILIALGTATMLKMKHSSSSSASAKM